MSCLVLRLRAAEDAPPAAAEELELVRLGHRGKGSSGDAPRVVDALAVLENADVAADRLRGEAVVARDDDDANARLATGLDARSHLGARGVSEACKADEGQAGLDLRVPRRICELCEDVVAVRVVDGASVVVLERAEVVAPLGGKCKRALPASRHVLECR